MKVRPCVRILGQNVQLGLETIASEVIHPDDITVRFAGP